jgi:TolB-like protein
MNRCLWVSIGIFFLLSGCGPRVYVSDQVNATIRSGARIVVMPFENLSGRENASEKITEYFVSSIRRISKLETIELGQTYEQMRRHRIRSSTFLTSDQIDSLAASLKADYITTGTVLEYVETDNQYLGKIPQVSVNLRIISCETGKTVWTGVSNARGDQSELVFGIGAVRSREELARLVIDKAVDEIAGLIRE